MESLTTIELATWTVPELATLYCAIEAELWLGQKSGDERDRTFVNQERIRRAMAQRQSRSR